MSVGGDVTYRYSIESPLFFEDAKYLLLASFLSDQQHALLGFAEHDLVSIHAAFTLWDEVEFDLDPDASTAPHLTGRAGKTGGAHVLNPDDCPGLHRLKTRFKQQFLKKWISYLDIGTLLLRTFLELFTRHGGAVDAVPAGLGSDVNHRISFARGSRIKDLIAAYQS